MTNYTSESVAVKQETARLATSYKSMRTPPKENKIIRGRFAPVDDILEDLARTAKLRRV